MNALRTLQQVFSRYKILALLIAIALIWAFFTWQSEGAFLTSRNISNLLRQMAITAMLACGMVFVIIAGEIDLSVGSMLGLLGGVAAVLDVSFQLPFWATLGIVLCLGTLLGLFNLKTSVTPPGLHAESANEGVPVVRWIICIVAQCCYAGQFCCCSA